MFILEEPYVSELLLKTLESNQFAVLNNEVAKKYSKNFNLNLIEKDTAIDFFKNKEELNFYSNSENSIDWVLSNFENTNLSKAIEVFKDKVEFRKLIAPIYPNFMFKELSLEELDSIDINSIKMPFIIKPAVGFLSLGVHKVNSDTEWKEVLSTIKNEVKSFSKLFPQKVVNSSKFIIEEIIKGTEFAIDAYYNNQGEAVILNIFKHPFVSAEDVSDRAYISSKEIINENLVDFESVLAKIGEITNLNNFPMHIELIKKDNGEIIPVEINPMRFAGWCTTDLAYYAYGINIYEYFFNQEKPDWTNILSKKGNEEYYFAMAETPQDINKSDIKEFMFEELKKEFSNILNFREIDYMNKPMFAILFGSVTDKKEITKILQLDMHNFINFKSKIHS
ncbi:ATP-grasp domain-containing protein [bacterium]|nr:ATP-grasp domain-containing protein [bacterium]